MAIFTVYLARGALRRSPDKKALHLTIGIVVIIGQSSAIIAGGMDMDNAFDTSYWLEPYSNSSRAAVCINLTGSFVNFVLLVASVSLMQKLPTAMTVTGGWRRRTRNTYTTNFDVENQASALRRYHQISTLSASISQPSTRDDVRATTRDVCGQNAVPTTQATTPSNQQQQVSRTPADIETSGAWSGSFNHALRRNAVHQLVPSHQTQSDAQTDPPPPSYREGPLFPHSGSPPRYDEYRTFSQAVRDDSVPPPSYEDATRPS